MKNFTSTEIQNSMEHVETKEEYDALWEDLKRQKYYEDEIREEHRFQQLSVKHPSPTVRSSSKITLDNRFSGDYIPGYDDGEPTRYEKL